MEIRDPFLAQCYGAIVFLNEAASFSSLKGLSADYNYLRTTCYTPLIQSISIEDPVLQAFSKGFVGLKLDIFHQTNMLAGTIHLACAEMNDIKCLMNFMYESVCRLESEGETAMAEMLNSLIKLGQFPCTQTARECVVSWEGNLYVQFCSL